MAKKKVTASSILNEANQQSAARARVDARQILNRATAQAGEPVRDRAAERERLQRKQETLAYLEQLKQQRTQRLAAARAAEEIAQARKDGTYTSPYAEATRARLAGMLEAKKGTAGLAKEIANGTEEVAWLRPYRRTGTNEWAGAEDRQEVQDARSQGVRTTGTEAAKNGNTGWRQIGNRYAFVTDNSPLPAQSFSSLKDYVDTMRAVDDYNAWKASAPVGRQRVGSLDAASQAFLQKWMGKRAEDAAPTMDEVMERYTQLKENPAQQELFWMEWSQNGALSEAVNRDEQAEKEQYLEAGKAKKAAYDRALNRLPAGMGGMATGSAADYYAYLTNAADGKGEGASEKNHPFAEYVKSNALIKGWGSDAYNANTDDRYDYADYGLNVPRWEDQRRARRWAVSTDEERRTYDTLKRVYGEEAAQGYEDSMQDEWDRRVTDYETGAARRVADGMGVVSSARDVLAAPVKGAGYMERLGRQMLGQEAGAYDQATLLARVTDESRGQVSRNIREKNGAVLSFVYDAGMSIFDNLINQAVWGDVGEMATLASMGASSAASSYNDAIDRGADVNEAMAAGTMAGLAEVIFEKVPLEKFLDLVQGKSSGKFVMELLRQSGIEAAEEMCTELANTITDSLIMGEKSNYAQSVAAYISQGMDGDAARRAAMLDVCKNIGLSGLGGGFSGMVMGGVGQGLGELNRRSEARAQTASGNGSGSMRTDTETARQAAVNVEAAAQGMPDLMNAEGLQVEYTPRDSEAGETAQEAEKEAAAEPMGPDGRTRESQPDGAAVDARGANEEAEETPAASPAPLTRREGIAVNEASGESEAVTVTGVRGVENGHVYFDVETADGEASVMSDMDVDLADADGMELLAAGAAGRMDARGVAAYLENYDAGIATARQYANAFAGIYTRARTGLAYDMAADSEAARRYLTQDAMREAYMAGLAAYNEKQGMAQAGTGEQGNEADSATGVEGITVYSLKETRGMSWEEQAKKVNDKRISSYATLNLGHSGETYAQFDMDDLDIGMNIGDLRKITRDAKGSRSAHALNESVIRALPNEIANPVAVFDNPSRNCVYVLTNQRDGKGNPVVAVIAKNSSDGSGTRMHQVKSAYGMQDVMGYMNDHLAGDAKKVVYNKKAFDSIMAVSHYIMNGLEYQEKIKHPERTISHETQNSNPQASKIKEASQRVRGLSEINQNAPSAEASAHSISKTETKSKKKPGVTRKYSTNAFAKLSGEQKRASIAQIELLDVLAKRTGRVIDIVDTIDGGRANAKYDSKTGRITIALDATEGAYLYAGMHELTHAMKAEHAGEWESFAEYVTQALKRSGQDMEQLIAYQMERFGYTREQALEEVICNTTPAVLQDESNLQNLLKTDRRLYERVLDWISTLLEDIRRAGERLSRRGKSWEQMDALRGDREALQGIYERMMGILEGKGGQEEYQKGTDGHKAGGGNSIERLSVSESFEAEYDAWAKDKKQEKTIEVGKTSQVLVGLGAKKQKVVMHSADITHALRHEGMTDEIMKQIPQMMENPIIVMKSSNLGNKNQHEPSRVVMYGNVTDKNGAPVIAVLELRERMKGGEILDMQLVKNAYGKDNRLDVQVQKSEILYLDPNKKRTNSWLQGLGLRLPSDTTNYGSMSSISYADGYVKMQGVRYENLLAQDADGAVGRAKFSLRDTDENVQTGLEALDEARRLAQGHGITALEAEKLAQHMKKLTNSAMDVTELAKEISRSYAYMEQGEGVDMRQVDEEQVNLMARVLETSRAKDMEHEERARPVRDYLRKTAIKLTERQRAEAENLTGSYNAYQRTLFGSVRLNQKNGAALDSVWGELSAMDAEWFPAGASEGDMARLLMEAADAAKPVYNTGLGMNAEEAAQYFAGEMNKAYLKLPGVRESARDIKAFDGSVQAYLDAQKRFQDTSLADYERALESIKKAREDRQRTEQQQREAALQKKYRDWRAQDTAKRRERETVNRYRQRVERTAGALLKWYESPTDTKHIPEDLREQVNGMITALDFTKKDTKTAVSLSGRIKALAETLDRASSENGDADGFWIERDQMWLDKLNRLAEVIPSHKAVYDLNGAELRELSRWMDSVKHVLTEANKMHGTNLGSVEETAAASIAEMSRKKARWQKKKIARELNDTFGIEMMDSFSYFKRLGPTAERVFEGVRRGFDKNVENVRQAKAYCEKLLEGVDGKALAGRRAKKTAYELESGETLELTRAQVMELYCLNGREQARGHLYGEGVRLYGDDNVRHHKLTRGDVEKITKTLTEDEKRIADGLQAFMARDCAAWGNEVSMKLFAYKKFGEKNYYPISVDRNETKTTRLDPMGDMASIAAIRNQGMTRGLTEGANNGIMLGSIFDTFTRHVSQMNAYSAYAVPLYDMQRWMNTRGVQTEIEQLYGAAGREYLLNFMKAINGTVERSQSRITRPLNWLTRNAKTAAVGANLQVAIQQPTSYARAVNMISGKYLAKAAVMKTSPELTDRYCAIAQWKKWGFYETDIGPNLRGMLLNDQTAVESLKDKSLWLAGKGDEWTLNHLWIACELETQDLHPELEAGTEAYYRHVGQRMSGIVDRTQVVDSVFHRSQTMRRKDSYTQLLTSFMAEPIKNYNMVMEALTEYAEARTTKNGAVKKLAAGKLGRALYAYALSGILAALVKSLTGAARSDDKDYREKYLDELGGNLADALNPLAAIPVVSDTVEMVMRGGQASGSLDNQSIQKIIWAVEEIQKYANGESELNGYGVAYKIAQAASSATGIAAGNLLRDANAIWQTATGRSATLSETGSRRLAKDNLYRAIQQGDREEQERLRRKMREQLGMSDKEIDAAVGERLAEDERIAVGWEARKEKRAGDLNRLKNELAREGYTGEMVDRAIQRYGDTQEEKEKEDKDLDEQLKVKLYTTGDGADAVRGVADGSVNLEDARLILSEMAADSDAKEPEKSVRSGILSEVKKDYVEALNRGDTKRMESLEQTLESLFDAPESEAKKDGVEQGVRTTIKGWRKEVWNAELETAVDGGNQDGARKAVAKMRKDGWTDESIAATLRSRYREAYLEGGAATRDRISRTLCGLGLKTEKGNEYFTAEKIREWGKTK